MKEGWKTLEIDSRSYSIRRVPNPGGAELSIAIPGSATVHLRPWSLTEHLAALDRYAFHDGELPRIDHEALAAEVLARTSVEPLDPQLTAELIPIALWWASGGDSASEAVPEARPWSCLDRARAVDECTDPGTGALRFGSYLRAMARSANDVNTDTLTGMAAANYLDKLVATNMSEPHTPDGPGTTALMGATLRVCRELKWTPGRVWSLPANELDRLLALLDRLETPTTSQPPPVRRTGLAAYPDAVIIEVS